MQIGCCMPVTKYDELAKIGYDYVEFPAWQIAEMSEEDCRILAKKLADGIPCVRLNAFCRGTPAIVGDAYCPDATREYAEKLAKMPRSWVCSASASALPPPANCRRTTTQIWLTGSAWSL